MKNLQLTTDFLDYNIDIYLINRLLKRSFNVMKPSFATHLLQKRTGLKPILELLGCRNFKTTEIYTQVSTQGIGKIKTPLDDFYKSESSTIHTN